MEGARDWGISCFMAFIFLHKIEGHLADSQSGDGAQWEQRQCERAYLDVNIFEWNLEKDDCTHWGLRCGGGGSLTSNCAILQS